MDAVMFFMSLLNLSIMDLILVGKSVCVTED